MIYIKTGKAIDYIRESSRIVAETLNLLKRSIQPGMKTLELDRIAEDYIRSKDGLPAFKGYGAAYGKPYPAALCVSVNEEVVHGIPGERVINDGDIVSLDIGVVKNGFFGDAAITVAVGNITEEKKKLMEVTEKSLYLGIEQAKEDNRVQDISAAVQEYVESHGFSVVRDLCGHGVGKKLHEDPSIPNFGRKGIGPKLKTGMTLAIEPMINIGSYKVYTGKDQWTVITQDGLASAHYEHTILVNGKQPEILTVI
ncbi:MAG: type I methionyl aminopeptidase [Ignavibacteria bacterium]|nr:type I methionyl aminopeptidase [Ignavibacteria bacterium]